MRAKCCRSTATFELPICEADLWSAEPPNPITKFADELVIVDVNVNLKPKEIHTVNENKSVFVATDN